MKVFIIHQYESCAYGEYYGIHKVYLTNKAAKAELKRLKKDKDFMYHIEEQEVYE